MKVNIKSTKFELNSAVKSLIEEKFGGLDKYFNNIQQIDVEVGMTTKGQQKGNVYFCEVNLSVPKKLLRHRKESSDIMKVIGEVKKGVQMELKKYKETL
jgi:ribosomal subunit interface protein